MSIQTVEQGWQELARRSDLVGKIVVFDNRIGDTRDEGKIGKIEVKDGYVIIHSPEIEAAREREGRGLAPFIRFKLDEERDPYVVGRTIFCDLDDYRQIQISL
jgi:hypothetical protein